MTSITSMRSIADTLTDLGMLDRIRAEFVPGLDRAEALHRQARQAPDTYASGRLDLLRRLAAGDTTPEDARAQYASLAPLEDARAGAVRLLADASGMAARNAEKALRRDSGRLLDALAARVAELVDITRTAANALPADVRSADAAISAGPKVVKVWQALDQAAAEWRSIRGLVKALRQGEHIPGNPADVDLFYGSAEGLALANRRRTQEKIPGTLYLALLIDSGADPCLLTPDDLAARIAEEEAAAAAKAAAEAPAPRRGSSYSPPHGMDGDAVDERLAELYADAKAEPQAEPTTPATPGAEGWQERVRAANQRARA